MGRPARGYRTADGKRVPGVTTIIGRFKESGGLIHWAWQCGIDGIDYRRKRDDAADVGTLAHELIEADIQGREPFLKSSDPAMLEPATKALEAFQAWRAQTSLKIVETERSMVCEEYRFGGTLDGIGELDGKLVLLDWKSSNKLYADYLIQVSAYRHLWEQTFPDRPIEGICLLRVGKEFGDFHFHSWPLEVMERGWKAFRKMRELYELDKELKRAVA